MAHDSPRLVICKPCNQYKYISRFSPNPICPHCSNISESTDENSIKEEYNIQKNLYNIPKVFEV